MTKPIRSVVADALRLDEEARALLAAELLASLDGPADPDAERAWNAEIERRIEAQYQLPEFGRRLASPANRAGVSEHFPDPSVRKSIDVDLARLERYDDLITDLELMIVREAKRHDGDAFHRLRSVPGIGKVLALTILYEIHDITRTEMIFALDDRRADRG